MTTETKRRVGRPAKPIPAEVLLEIEECLNDGWPFQEITRTYGVGYHALNRLFPGRQWSTRDAAMHGVLVRQMKIQRVATSVPQVRIGK